MPWPEMSPMDYRMQFLAEYLSELFTMDELAAQYGISRKTGYKWVARYGADGPSGLADRSRRPRHSPTAVAPALVQALLDARRQHPTWGPRKLLGIVRRAQPETAWPQRSTVADLLRRAGLVVPRRRRSPHPHGGHTLAPITAVNGTWTTDQNGSHEHFTRCSKPRPHARPPRPAAASRSASGASVPNTSMSLDNLSHMSPAGRASCFVLRASCFVTSVIPGARSPEPGAGAVTREPCSASDSEPVPRFVRDRFPLRWRRRDDAADAGGNRD